MPVLGRQCSTTVSPGFTVVTPGPISTTSAEASCPSRCGRNLSGPLSASISLICAPQIVVYSTRTSTCPASRASGISISSITNGRRDSARIAARTPFFSIIVSLFEVDEFVVARISEVIVEPYPRRCIKECFASESPTLHVELFKFASIALYHNVPSFPDPLDFSKRSLQLEDLEVVQAAERDHEIERLVAVRVAILRFVAEQEILDLGVSVAQTMTRDVETDQ